MKKLFLVLFFIAGSCAPLKKSGILELQELYRLNYTWLGMAIKNAKGKDIWQFNAKKFFLPASNQKLVTVSVAYRVLGPKYAWKTYVFLDDSGNIVLKGTGDPSFTSENLRYIAKRIALKLKPERRIKIFYDPSFFDTIRWGPGWEWEDRKFYYAAPVTTMNLNENVLLVYFNPFTHAVQTFPDFPGNYELKPDSFAHAYLKNMDTLFIFLPESLINLKINKDLRLIVTLWNPEDFTCMLFANFLRHYGIPAKYKGFIKKPEIYPETLFIYNSPPLRQIAYRLLKISQNLYAEVFLKTIGAQVIGPPGTWPKGIEAVYSVLSNWGLDTSQIKIADGSGLSRHNYVTPEFFTNLLFKISREPWFPDFVVSLPVVGQDGTLKRFELKEGFWIRAKTGTMTGVRCLSGYIFEEGKVKYIFSFMSNNYKGSFKRVDSLYANVWQKLIQNRR